MTSPQTETERKALHLREEAFKLYSETGHEVRPDRVTHNLFVQQVVELCNTVLGQDLELPTMQITDNTRIPEHHAERVAALTKEKP